jgi:DNA-binding MarR family transcriptional regulator
LWRRWLRANQELTSALAARLSEDSGLSGADYTVLAPLSESPGGVIRARELGRIIVWDRDRLAHQVRRMEARGLVARERCEDDARGSMIRITPDGRAAIEQAAPGHVAATRECFIDLLSDEEKTMLADICDRILDKLAVDR